MEFVETGFADTSVVPILADAGDSPVAPVSDLRAPVPRPRATTPYFAVSAQAAAGVYFVYDAGTQWQVRASYGATWLPELSVAVGIAATWDTRPWYDIGRNWTYLTLAGGWPIPIAGGWSLGPQFSFEEGFSLPEWAYNGYVAPSGGLRVSRAPPRGLIRKWDLFLGVGNGYFCCGFAWAFLPEASSSLHFPGGWYVVADASLKRVGLAFGWEFAR